ncbi:MAG: DUF1501 domain-containing protein [Pirellulaceae bacterium]|nr:DUF1501 domain-containing protein [Pirellulaceae bacterium]
MTWPQCPGHAAPCASRREFLQQSSLGFGWLAWLGLSCSTQQAISRESTVLNPQQQPMGSRHSMDSTLHHAPRAKRVIFLFMDGGVSQVDSFDPKPELTRLSGQPAQWRSDPLSQAVSAGRKWLGSPWQFDRYGQSGLWVSELFPYAARVADDLCVVRSLVGQSPLHGAQSLLLHTGRSVAAAPSIGSWVSYGLGRVCDELPSYVLLNNDWIPNGGFQNFASSFLPATHQAALVRARGVPVDNIQSSDRSDIQQAKLEFLQHQDRRFAARQAAKEIEAAISIYETAALMQTRVPQVCDVADETAETLALYGVDRSDPHDQLYALQCLRARRMAESGVRFIEVTCPNTHGNNSPWDQHGDLKLRHAENARITDQPVAALLVDLKRRGLLDDTLVVWAGEMGRTPHSSGTDGRDHHVSGYTIWLAGGGIRGGMTFGETDELGMSAIENRLDIHDIHATILHLLGLDHERLTFRFGGRDMRLTDVHGRVIKQIMS